MKKISQERLQEIIEESIRFPLLITNNPDSLKTGLMEDIDVHKVMTVSDMDTEMNEFGLPKSIDLVIENANGQTTYGEYILVNSSINYKSEHSDPIYDN